MLSARELEPYYLYEATEKEFEINRYAHTFEDLAMNTVNIFFELKPKGKSSDSNSGTTT
jgi:hypothetical protein